jgi:hypothetical protein
VESDYRRVPPDGLATGAWFLAGMLAAGVVIGLVSFLCAQVMP